jgi:cobyrinic acid a,c-diamide synthase
VPRLLISAAHKSSGKTTVTLGLAAALTARGLHVQPFKKGPDYIDPMWLARAAGRPCFNLDPYLSDARDIVAALAREAAGADIALIEGNKGLHDGLDLDGSNSNAALARLLRAPVVLVIDARGMTRGIAPLLLGFQAFDPEVHIAGVILNQVGGPRHEGKLRAVIEHYTDIPVLGAIARDARLALPERHLGLTPDAEFEAPATRVAEIGAIVAAGVDVDRLLAIAAAAPDAMPGDFARAAAPGRPPPTVRIGIARDRAFGFYYPDDLQALQAAGAELVPFDTLRDAALPAVDGVFIGGGFPEVYMKALQDNASLRHTLRESIEAGLPVYAECGGLMYLARSITWGPHRCDMVGAIPADVVMHERAVGRGYVQVEETGQSPWGPAPGGDHAPASQRGHEFHHSSLVAVAPDLRYAYRVRRGHGIDGQRDGVVVHNTLASYAHLRTGAGSDWAARFVDFVRRCSLQRGLADRPTPATPMPTCGREGDASPAAPPGPRTIAGAITPPDATHLRPPARAWAAVAGA